MDDKPKRRKIDANIRDAVWFKYMGNNIEGKCYCCQIRTIHITDFQVGHNIAVAKGGNDQISNLRPICGKCNRGMGTMSIESYKKKYFKDQEKPGSKSNTLKKETTTEKPLSKKALLKTLSKPNLKKIIRECDLNYAPFFDGEDKEDLIAFIMKSKEVTVKKIEKIVENS